jgi:hypothetical protein
MKEITRIAGAVLVYTSICTAQNPATPLKFEVASIKPADLIFLAFQRSELLVTVWSFETYQFVI